MIPRAAGMRSEPIPLVVAYAPRERARDLLRRAFPRRRGCLVLARTAAELRRTLMRSLVDAVVVDVVSPTDDTWSAAHAATEFPCIPFIALTAPRLADAPTIARCAALDFAGILADGIDDGVVRETVEPLGFTNRFAEALAPAAGPLKLTGVAQQRAWTWIIAQGGRPVRTDLMARALGVTREHLSRSFATGGAPNLKRVIDFVRVVGAAELAKCPGYDTIDVANVLGFASASHLATTAQRVCGVRATSLARLRTGDILERFLEGRGRSRG